MKKRIIAALAVIAGTLSLGASPALAHQGDWWTQYNITGNYACVHYGACSYSTSAVVSDHSRRFTWIRYDGIYRCALYVYIGHSYEVWDTTWGWCLQY